MSEQILNKIEIAISGRKYPIKVNEEEELAVRNIEKKLNQQVHQFQLKYPNNDKLDCVIMTMLTLAFENSKLSDETNKNGLIDKLDDIDRLLDKVI